MSKKNAPEFTWLEDKQLYRKKIKSPVTGKWVPVYGHTKQELREKIRQKEASLAEAAQEKERPLVYQYAARWYSLNTGDLSESRKEDYRNAINNHICPVIGEMALRDVKPDDILRVIAVSREKAPSKSSQQKIVNTLKRIFDAAEENGYIKKSPCKKLKSGGAPSEEKKALTGEQCETLIDAVRGTRAYLFVLIGLYAGLRREEIAGLQWDSVFLDAEPPYIEVKRAVIWEKNNKPILSESLKTPKSHRMIPIAPQLLGPLTEEKAKSTSSFVVPGKDGGVMSYTSFDNLWGIIETRSVGHVRRKGRNGKIYEREKKLGDKIARHNITVTIDFNVTPHLLRHTFITNLILAGANIKTVQYLAGHAKSKITLDIYTHLMENQPSDTLGAISAAYGSNQSASE